MSRPPSRIPQAGFTFVELLLALALAGLVAAILGLLVRGLFFAGEGQSVRLNSAHAARAALRTLAREVSCAFAPPVENLPPLKLSATTEPGKPQVVLSFYAPVPAPLGYDMDQVTYEVMANRREPSELLRISAPCSGPRTNAPVTNLLFSGRFSLAIQAITNGTSCDEWPPPKTDKPVLPTSLRLTLSLPGQPPLQTEVLIQTANGIRSPVERKETPPGEADDSAPEPDPAP